MASADLNIDSSNPNCSLCTEQYNRLRASVTNCSQCKLSLCSECFEIHRQKHEQELVQLQDLYNQLKTKINEKDKYINDTSHESIDIVVNWYQRLINDLIESQTQIIENIHNERDRARDELAQFGLNIHSLDQDMQQSCENMNIKSMQTRLNELTMKLSNYQITKDICLPNARTFQPRYKIFYEFKNPSLADEDWDIETNETTNIPLPSHLTLSSTYTKPTETTPLFFSDNSQTFITPTDDDNDGEDTFQWYEELEKNNTHDSEYLLDPKLYHLGIPRCLPSNIQLVASNGHDLLCYSRQMKHLIFISDGDVNSIILQWYHGHIIQLVWFDSLELFVALTDDDQCEIYTIESSYSFRLKIRLHTRLPKADRAVLKDQIFLRTDDSHVFVYYERVNGRKRLRLLNSTFECAQSYAIDKCFQRDEHVRSGDNGMVIGLGVNQEYVVLFVRSAIDDDAAGQAASVIQDTRLLIFNKSKMCFIRRLILPNQHFDLPFVIHFINFSSFFIIDQTYHLLRFFHYEKEIGQIKLSSSNNASILNSTTTSKSNLDSQYASIVLMNDGSVLISNNTNNLLQLILHDQTNTLDY